MSFFIFFELSTFLHASRIIHFELIKTIIQILHIALINIYWNTHNNLMPHIYTWTS
jgi:hypothetical protein